MTDEQTPEDQAPDQQDADQQPDSQPDEQPEQPEASAESDDGGSEAEDALAAAKAAISSAGDATTEDAAPDAEAEAALEAAKQSVSDTSSAAAAAAGSDPQPFEAPDFGGAQPAENKTDINLLGDVDLDVKIELGRTKMVVEDVLKLSDGAVVELDKLAGDPVDVFVNDRHVARGEVLVLNDQFCVRVNEIIDPLADKLSGNAQPAAGDAQPEAG